MDQTRELPSEFRHQTMLGSLADGMAQMPHCRVSAVSQPYEQYYLKWLIALDFKICG